LPNELPDNETLDSQQIKRELMLKMAQTGDSINWSCVKAMMAETYNSQRETINLLLPMEQILARWPFIGKVSDICQTTQICSTSHFAFCYRLTALHLAVTF